MKSKDQILLEQAYEQVKSNTEHKVLNSVREAIKFENPKSIKFEYIDSDTNFRGTAAARTFSVNGITFRTGFDTESHKFPETINTIDDLELLLWWLEKPDTEIAG